MKRLCYLIQSLLFMSIKLVELRSNTLPHQSQVPKRVEWLLFY